MIGTSRRLRYLSRAVRSLLKASRIPLSDPGAGACSSAACSRALACQVLCPPSPFLLIHRLLHHFVLNTTTPMAMMANPRLDLSTVPRSKLLSNWRRNQVNSILFLYRCRVAKVYHSMFSARIPAFGTELGPIPRPSRSVSVGPHPPVPIRPEIPRCTYPCLRGGYLRVSIIQEQSLRR